MKLSQLGTGEVSNGRALRDTKGTGTLPIQAEVVGTATFSVYARVANDAPWFALKTGESAAFLEGISWVPFVKLEVTSGTGTVNLWVGDK